MGGTTGEFLQDADRDEAGVVAGVRDRAGQDAVRQGGRVVGGRGGGRGELAQRVADRALAALDQAVSEQQQRVAALQLEAGLVVLGGRVEAEQHAAGQRQRLRRPRAGQDRRQVAGPRPPQHPGVRVVPAADHGSRDALGEVAGRVVEVPEQVGGAGAGRREAAQRVARGDHAGHRVDAVTGDVAHHEQQFLARQQQRVVPVARHQPPCSAGR